MHLEMKRNDEKKTRLKHSGPFFTHLPKKGISHYFTTYRI
jgi:hypothetical protein